MLPLQVFTHQVDFFHPLFPRRFKLSQTKHRSNSEHQKTRLMSKKGTIPGSDSVLLIDNPPSIITVITIMRLSDISHMSNAHHTSYMKRLIYSYYLTVPCGAWVMLSHSYNHIHQNGYVYPIKLDTGPWNILKPEFPRLFPRQGSLLQLHGCSGSSMCSGRGIVNISLTERTGIPLAQASDT